MSSALNQPTLERLSAKELTAKFRRWSRLHESVDSKRQIINSTRVNYAIIEP